MVNIQKKNLKGRKGTQRWRRNIIVSVEQHGDVDFSQKQNKEVDFEINANPINIYENKDRFKKKPINESLLSKNEMQRIRKMSQNQKRIDNTVNGGEKQEIQDAWGNDDTQMRKTRNHEFKRDVKSVVTPHPGQSYNPQLQQYSNLLDCVINQENKQQQKLVNAESEEQKTQKLIQRQKQIKYQQKLSKITKIHGKHITDRLILKRKNHSILMIKAIKKELAQNEENTQKRLREEKQEKKKEERIKRLEGRIVKPQKMGKRILGVTLDEVVAEEDLKGQLRHVTQGDFLVRSQFDGFIRRGLIEPKSKSNKLSKAKAPKYKIKEKFHNDNHNPTLFKTDD